MKEECYSEIVPNSDTRTALSGMLGREFWNIAAEAVYEQLYNSAELWVVGKITHYPAWEFQGVYLFEQSAVDACKDETYFIGPVIVNEMITGGSLLWPETYHPLSRKDF